METDRISLLPISSSSVVNNISKSDSEQEADILNINGRSAQTIISGDLQKSKSDFVEIIDDIMQKEKGVGDDESGLLPDSKIPFPLANRMVLDAKKNELSAPETTMLASEEDAQTDTVPDILPLEGDSAAIIAIETHKPDMSVQVPSSANDSQPLTVPLAEDVIQTEIVKQDDDQAITKNTAAADSSENSQEYENVLLPSLEMPSSQAAMTVNTPLSAQSFVDITDADNSNEDWELLSDSDIDLLTQLQRKAGSILSGDKPIIANIANVMQSDIAMPLLNDSNLSPDITVSSQTQSLTFLQNPSQMPTSMIMPDILGQLDWPEQPNNGPSLGKIVLNPQYQISLERIAMHPNHLKITFDPHHMGTVDLIFDQTEGADIVATVRSDNQQALDMMRRDAQSLLRFFQEAGLNLQQNNLAFSFQGQHSSEQYKSENNDSTFFQDEGVPAHAQPIDLSSLDIGDGVLDIRI